MFSETIRCEPCSYDEDGFEVLGYGLRRKGSEFKADYTGFLLNQATFWKIKYDFDTLAALTSKECAVDLYTKLLKELRKRYVYNYDISTSSVSDLIDLTFDYILNYQSN